MKLRIGLVYGCSVLADVAALLAPVPFVGAVVAVAGVAACWSVSR